MSATVATLLLCVQPIQRTWSDLVVRSLWCLFVRLFAVYVYVAHTIVPFSASVVRTVLHPETGEVGPVSAASGVSQAHASSLLNVRKCSQCHTRIY